MHTRLRSPGAFFYVCVDLVDEGQKKVELKEKVLHKMDEGEKEEELKEKVLHKEHEGQKEEE